MYSEKIVEEGIVVEAKKGFATVKLAPKAECHECGAKLFCKPSESKEENFITVKDPFGVHVGDLVKFSAKGKDIAKEAIYFYGFPLIILIISILAGMNFFNANKEALSFLTAVGAFAVYWVYMRKKFRSENAVNYPQIESVKFKV